MQHGTDPTILHKLELLGERSSCVVFGTVFNISRVCWHRTPLKNGRLAENDVFFPAVLGIKPGRAGCEARTLPLLGTVKIRGRSHPIRGRQRIQGPRFESSLRLFHLILVFI